jgi:GDP-mannose 6-dehydrogenase
MNINVYGLGYVGSVCMASLAKNGHCVTGVDKAAEKVNLINQGIPPVVEKGLSELMQDGVKSGRIRAVMSGAETFADTDLSLICVGTPVSANGDLNLSDVLGVAEHIGNGLRESEKYHVVLLRSTVTPGTSTRVGDVIEKSSGRKRGPAFEVIYNPEFMREGTAIHDFHHPPFTLVGTSSRAAFDIVAALYEGVDGPIRMVPPRVAEILKIVNNTFHALKVCFGNEIGNICRSFGIDSHEVMDLFCLDTKLNLSPYYLKPGFAYGGSCLTKDLSALRTMAHNQGIETPVINAIEKSNERQKQLLVDRIAGKGFKRIGILGLSFKPGTDDVRDSPILDVVGRLLKEGYHIRVYDKDVLTARRPGPDGTPVAPLIEAVFSENPASVIAGSELLVIAKWDIAFEVVQRFPEKHVIDLVRIPERIRQGIPHYEGISW